MQRTKMKQKEICEKSTSAKIPAESSAVGFRRTVISINYSIEMGIFEITSSDHQDTHLNYMQSHFL